MELLLLPTKEISSGLQLYNMHSLLFRGIFVVVLVAEKTVDRHFGGGASTKIDKRHQMRL